MITEIKTCLVLKCTLCNLLNYLSTISSYNHKISLISVQINKTCVHWEIQEVALGEKGTILISRLSSSILILSCV